MHTATLINDALIQVNKCLSVITEQGNDKIVIDKDSAPATSPSAFVPACTPASLGDAGFRRDHRLRFSYVCGAMANGIASVELVCAIARFGGLGFFGAAGLPLEQVTQAIDQLQNELADAPWGVNLIHSPSEPELEMALVKLLLQKHVHLVEASAYLALTPAVVKYRTAGIYRDATGNIQTPNRIVAKVSRVEVAEQFLSPPPQRLLKALVAAGDLTEQQAKLAESIPMAQDITAEADSGGHTDNQSPFSLLPTLLALRDAIQQKYQYAIPLRIGAAGGIATPAAAAAAFAMGAAYIVTGSVNQACLEAGTSDYVREILAAADQADITMAPAADMFEMGVKVQVLKRGTMFAMRAQKLYELYNRYDALESLPAADQAQIEKQVFQASLAEVWQQTRQFFNSRDPKQISEAERNPKHKMALLFRSYLGQASRWANAGEPSRHMDYQIWCGPAMGAFNRWTADSPLADWRNRRVADVAFALLFGAAVQMRLTMLRSQGVNLPPGAGAFGPLREADVGEHCQ